MAARFPQSTTSIAYRIKPAWASKVHAIWWAADADKLHRLKSGDSATTIITRSASGATFDAANGVIAGNNDATYFTDAIAGGFGGLQENSNFVFGGAFYGDMFNGGLNSTIIGSKTPPDGFSNGFRLRPSSYTVDFKVNGGGGNDVGGIASDDVAGMVTIAVRHNQADATAKLRPWINGAESTGDRAAASPSSTDKIGDSGTGTLVYLGGTGTGTGNTKAHFECAFLCASLSDADMATITSDPSSIIEVSSSAAALEGAAAASASATGALTTSAAVKGIRLTTAQASMTGLRWAWFDSQNPSAWTAPAAKGSGESTDGTGVLEIDITGTGLSVTDWGFLVVQKEGATKEDDVLFAGRLQVIGL